MSNSNVDILPAASTSSQIGELELEPRDLNKTSSYYSHNHSDNALPLNVTDAHIVQDKSHYISGKIPETRDIALPFHKDKVTHISLDIGGSLAKLVYFTKDEFSKGGVLNFFKIETTKIDELIQFIKENVFAKHYNHHCSDFNDNVSIVATGGGAFKFNEKLTRELKCNIQKEDELQCLIIGLDFLITQIKNEIFYYDEIDHKYIELEKTCDEDSIYPYLLVNIGSGVGMIKVTGPGPDNFVRVGGSSLGGGTLWGLLSVLTDAEDFDEMLTMAQQGNNENVDLLVGDIYGRGYNNIGLKSNHIASSMGKVFKKVLTKDEIAEDIIEDRTSSSERERRLGKFKQEDIARSLLYAVSNNIGQIAYLQAQRYNLKKIYFAGSYIRGHPQTIRTLSYAIDFWSEGQKKAYFLKHEGYLGTMGAFLKKEL